MKKTDFQPYDEFLDELLGKPGTARRDAVEAAAVASELEYRDQEGRKRHSSFWRAAVL